MTEWLSVKEAALRIGGRTHPDTVRKRLESGEYHGHQRSYRAPWLIHPDAIDAWVRGGDGKAECGCATPIQLTRKKAS